jgi:hypothetical protein
MKSHLNSLHRSIWDVVEIEMLIANSDEESYNLVEVEQIVHHNSQATTVLLASLCSEEYNKVNDFEGVKDIWCRGFRNRGHSRVCVRWGWLASTHFEW